MARSRALVLLLVLAVASVSACGSAQPWSSAAAAEVASTAASAAPSVAPTATPSPTPAPTPTIAPSPTPDPTLPPAAVKLPAGWKPVSLDVTEMSDQLAQLEAQNPQLAGWLQTAVSAGMLKVITNLAVRYHGTRLSGDVVIARLGPLGGADLDAIKSIMEPQFTAMGATSVKAKKVTLPAGGAVQFDFAYTFKSAAGSLGVHDRAWVVNVNDVAYEIATTCLNDVPNCLADGSLIAISFRPAEP
jgi:hypothetical protein